MYLNKPTNKTRYTLFELSFFGHFESDQKPFKNLDHKSTPADTHKNNPSKHPVKPENIEWISLSVHLSGNHWKRHIRIRMITLRHTFIDECGLCTTAQNLHFVSKSMHLPGCSTKAHVLVRSSATSTRGTYDAHWLTGTAAPAIPRNTHAKSAPAVYSSPRGVVLS